MRKFLKFITGRLAWTFLFLLIQAAFLFVMLKYAEVNFGLSVFNFVLGLVISFAIFTREDAPEYRLSWILLISVVPVFGCFMYLIFGNKKRGRWEKRKVASYQELMQEHSIAEFKSSSDSCALLPPEGVSAAENEKLPTEDLRLQNYLSSVTGCMTYADTEFTYYPLGDYCYPIMLQELKKAKKFIFMEYFIYEKGQFWDSVLALLKEKVSEGVEVRLMYDDMGSINTLPAKYYLTLREYGIKAVAFNPVRPRLNPRLNYRDHRKVCIIDGNTAISGGINIADEYINRTIRFGHWKDNAFLLRGSGVWNYTFMFLQLWLFAAPKEYYIEDFSAYYPTEKRPSDGLVQSFGDSPLDNLFVAENAYIHVLNTAKNYVWISTPYLILDSAMINALKLAAQSGVDVRIITPAIPDKKIVYALTKSNYSQLLSNGVRIFEYQPGFIHSKMFVSDDQRAIVGTTNMDFRSFYLHFESGSVFYGGSMVRSVKSDFSETFNLCKEVTLQDVKNRSWLMKLTGQVAKLIAPLL
jgi:cardiolipin synthase A/B